MVTKEEVREVRNFLKKFNSKTNVSISDDVIKAIDSMCSDYEFRYNASWS